MKRYIISLLTIFATWICAGAQTDRDYVFNTEPVETDMVSATGNVLTAQTSRASDNNTPVLDYKKTAEWGKYKVLRAIGWSALGVGLPVTFIGLVGVGLSTVEGGDPFGGFIAIMAAGGVLTLSSIPILISAYHYRNKAKKMALNIGLTQISAPSLAMTNRMEFTPALSVALKF